MRGSCLRVLGWLALVSCASEPPLRSTPVVVLPSASSATPLAVASTAPLDLPGIDTSNLDARERAEWSGLVHELMAPCPSTAVPLDQCILNKPGCRTCAPAAAWVARAVRDGKGEGEIHAAYTARFDPSTLKTLPLDGSPMKGSPAASVTIVEFVDLECPHCRIAAAMVDRLVADHPATVRLVFKSYPISFHAHAEAAARAAFAAGLQGKFWEMERALLDGQDHLEARDLEDQARALKLDVPRWRADMASPAVVNRVAEDRRLGEELRIKGTPTFYVDGREVDFESDTIEDRVREALEGL